ncbi:hypothetical protein AT291_03685 [Porphyromonas gingivalis]|nr:hypothetical protein AT291_03685 [Porphyromonas gingivalis]
MVVFNEAYFRIPIIGYFSFVCAEKHTKSFAVDIFFLPCPARESKRVLSTIYFSQTKKQRRL